MQRCATTMLRLIALLAALTLSSPAAAQPAQIEALPAAEASGGDGADGERSRQPWLVLLPLAGLALAAANTRWRSGRRRPRRRRR